MISKKRKGACTESAVLKAVCLFICSFLCGSCIYVCEPTELVQEPRHWYYPPGNDGIYMRYGRDDGARPFLPGPMMINMVDSYFLEAVDTLTPKGALPWLFEGRLNVQ